MNSKKDNPLQGNVKSGTLNLTEHLMKTRQTVSYEIDQILYQQFQKLHAPFEKQTIQFEFLFFFYLISHLLIQNFNIYRTNFYNYNFYLLFLTVLVLCKRLIEKYYKLFKRSSTSTQPVTSLFRGGVHSQRGLVKSTSFIILPFELFSLQVILNVIIITIILSNALYLLIHLFLLHPLVNFLFLVYPVICYFLLFGFKSQHIKASQSIEKHLFYKLETILYNSFECSYFAGFLPLKFLQYDYLYFDYVRCILLIFYLFINSFVLLFTHLLSTSFYELFFQAQMLGCWKRIYKAEALDRRRSTRLVGGRMQSDRVNQGCSDEADEYESVSSRGVDQNGGAAGGDSENLQTDDISVWSKEHGPYAKGSVVIHNKKYYLGIGDQNSAEPGHLVPYVLFIIFANPERTQNWLVMLQTIIVVSQLALVFNSNQSNLYAVMLLFNYYILYMCISTRHATKLANLQVTTISPS